MQTFVKSCNNSSSYMIIYCSYGALTCRIVCKLFLVAQ